jgi:hypothetical protein
MTAMPDIVTDTVDPIGTAIAVAIGEVLFGASVSVTHDRPGKAPAEHAVGEGSASATAPGPDGWDRTITVELEPRIAALVRGGDSALGELLGLLPRAGLRAAALLRDDLRATRPTPAVRRAVRDTLATEILACYFASRLDGAGGRELIAETVDYLIELTGTRVEAHDLTHGVVMADVFADAPRLEFRYPDDLRPVKRAPLLFDGQRAVLVVDPQGRARTELQPLLVRRGEHWTAFPVELAASIGNMIGGGPAADIVARAAYMVSARPQGAILAIVDDPAALDGVVSLKDRYDLRSEIDLAAMRPETRLHHLLDVEDLDEHTLARLAALDGATVVDPGAGLVAYGAIVTTADSEQEGARTAAARTLSRTALVVLKVSVDGDITIFRDGAVVTTLLGHPSTSLHRE